VIERSASEPATNLAASGNPFDLIPTRQLFVVLGRVHKRSLTDIAKLLGVTRMTVHRDLNAALRALRTYPTQAPVTLPPSDMTEDLQPYDCPDHGNDCHEACSYLVTWMAKLDGVYPDRPRAGEKVDKAGKQLRACVRGANQ
jgi:hypothetical protein